MKREMKSEKRLGREEKELLTSFEKGEWKRVKDLEKEKALARQTAMSSRQRKVLNFISAL